jgi:hypothetical protein
VRRAIGAQQQRIQQLTLTASTCYILTLRNMQPVAPQESILRELSKLQQLQQVTLRGWVWEVSPLLVAGLKRLLLQLSSIRLKGCWGVWAGSSS